MSEPQGFFPASVDSLPEQPRYAGFWWRYLACFIDGIILQIIAVLIVIGPAIVLGVVLAFSDISKDAMQLFSNLFGTALGWLISWLYYALMEASVKQATLGKMICRLKVVNVQGERLGFGQASLRHWARVGHTVAFSLIGFLVFGLLGFVLTGASLTSLSKLTQSSSPEFLMPFIGILLGVVIGAALGSIAGYLPALWTAKKQTLHDLIAGTVVVKKDY